MADNIVQLKEKLRNLERQCDTMLDKMHELDKELERMKGDIKDIGKIVEDIEK